MYDFSIRHHSKMYQCLNQSPKKSLLAHTNENVGLALYLAILLSSLVATWELYTSSWSQLFCPRKCLSYLVPFVVNLLGNQVSIRKHPPSRTDGSPPSHTDGSPLIPAQLCELSHRLRCRLRTKMDQVFLPLAVLCWRSWMYFTFSAIFLSTFDIEMVLVSLDVGPIARRF